MPAANSECKAISTVGSSGDEDKWPHADLGSRNDLHKRKCDQNRLSDRSETEDPENIPRTKLPQIFQP